MKLSGKKQTHSHTMGSVVVLGTPGEARGDNHRRVGGIKERYD